MYQSNYHNVHNSVTNLRILFTDLHARNIQFVLKRTLIDHMMKLYLYKQWESTKESRTSREESGGVPPDLRQKCVCNYFESLNSQNVVITIVGNSMYVVITVTNQRSARLLNSRPSGTERPEPRQSKQQTERSLLIPFLNSQWELSGSITKLSSHLPGPFKHRNWKPR